MTIPRVAAAVAAAALAVTCGLALPAAKAAQNDLAVPAQAAMTAEQIVDRSVEVRGGLQAWRKVAAIIWEGHLESARSTVPSLRFRLEEKRPGKSRFEINEPSQRSLRVFNGTSGWKMKLGSDGRPEVKQFSAQEIRFARSAPGLEGPLIDFRAKGATVELEGTEELDGRKNYRIAIKMFSAERQTVWVDAETFLETRYDRSTYDTAGARGTVSVRFREYKEIEGLAVPSVIEISGAAGGKPDRMVIERVALNPEIDDSDFDGLGGPRGRATAESRTAPR
jgi:outer membrane lipoprotein-sorting protein